jgi:hypothetical protein
MPAPRRAGGRGDRGAEAPCAVTQLAFGATPEVVEFGSLGVHGSHCTTLEVAPDRPILAPSPGALH